MADESLRLNYSSLADPEFKAELGRRFPLVLERLEQYSKAIGKVSDDTKVHLELRRSGTGGMAIFTIAARLRLENPDRKTLERGAKAAIEALKTAYSQVLKI
jgi:hypothetical protein